jgi:CHAT domain-containing protein
MVAPIEKALDPTRTLFIESDQFLGLLPWPALVRPDGSYFGHVYSLVNTPGLLYEKPGKSRRHVMDRILVAYPGAVELDHTLYQPLPQAKDEADFVAGLAAHSTYLRDNSVSAKKLLAELPKATSFLFSGHATTRAYGGELVIHGEKSGNVFSASRLAGTNLSEMKLVVLSACSTAGEPETATDPNGLVKAFLNAGTESVVASQWDVSSGSTANLVRDLFIGLSENPTGKLALREVWRNAAARSSHPYYWAAFQVYGPFQ